MSLTCMQKHCHTQEQIYTYLEPILELALIDQAGPELTEILLLSAGIKGMHHHRPAVMETKWCPGPWMLIYSDHTEKGALLKGLTAQPPKPRGGGLEPISQPCQLSQSLILRLFLSLLALLSVGIYTHIFLGEVSEEEAGRQHSGQ